MKVEIQREALASAMRVVGTVVPHISPKPILTCVRLAADEKKVAVRGTDLETTVTCEVAQVHVAEPGEMVVRAELFEQIVRAGKSDVLLIESTENGCEVREADARYSLFSPDTESFPTPPTDESEFDSAMPLDEFRAGVRRTEFAAARQSGRYAIAGVFLKQGKGQARLVATDGKRLACCQVKDEAEMETKGIVPPKAMRVLAGIVGEEGVIRVKVRSPQAWFECGPVSMVTNLMAGTFPPYEDIIPKDCAVKLELPRLATLSAIRKVAIMQTDPIGNVALCLSRDRLVFEAREGDKVMGQAAVPVQYQGEPMEVWFKPSTVTDALRVIEAETFGLELQSPDRAALIRGPDEYMYVFMPIATAA